MQRRWRVAISGLALSAMAALGAEAQGVRFQYNILSVTNTGPGQLPRVRFSVTDPGNGNAPYNLKTDAAWVQPKGNSRLFLQIGWDTRDFNNTGSLSQIAPNPVGPPNPPGPALPIGIDVLAKGVALGDGTYEVTSTIAIPVGATGSGVAALEGHPAVADPVTGALTVRQPVKSVYKTFAITTLAARRKVVEVAKCKGCHGVLTVHGNNRTDEPQVCVICHNPNNTDIVWRVKGDGPEVPLDFKRMVHSIHAAKIRHTPYQIVGFQHTTNDFSKVKFPGELNNCQKCHVAGSYGLPLNAAVQPTTVVTQSQLLAQYDSVTNKFSAYNLVDADPTNDLKMTPTVAVCSSCHDSSEVRRHMERNGGSFAIAAAQAAGRERCANCHGKGKDKDVVKVHSED